MAEEERKFWWNEASIMHHVCIVLILLCFLSAYNCCHPLAYIVSFIYLYQVHERCNMRLMRKLQYEERKTANKRRVLTDTETVRWLNHAMRKVWPICMEQIMSQKFFLPIIPWFLDKYKPWTVKEAVVQQLYLGRSPPLFTDIRVHESTDGDHLVLELGLNFLTADDMSAILYAKLRRRLGFGIMTKVHLTGMHIEGKVLVGVKFTRNWPFISRLRISFAILPYFQFTVKPISNHGLDVSEVPGIAGWLDKLLAIVFEETLVEPNMLVVDMKKFVAPESKNWFSMVGKEPVAYINIKVIEAAEVKPSDLSGSSNPYVQGHLGPYRFKSQIQKKTITPKWQEEFKIPLSSWDSHNVLAIVVRDKDHFVDGFLGNCSVNINDLSVGHRHDIWLPLENARMGRLHLAVTVLVTPTKAREQKGEETKMKKQISDSVDGGTTSVNKTDKIVDSFEPINVEGQKETSIWVHHPGSETCQAWKPRRGKSRSTDTQIFQVEATKLSTQFSFNKGDKSSSDDSKSGRREKIGHKIHRGFLSILHRHPSRKEAWNNDIGESGDLSHPNFVLNDSLSEGNSPETPSKRGMKGMAKNMLKSSARNLKHVLSRKGSKRFMENSVSSGCSSGDDNSVCSSYSASFEGFPVTLSRLRTDSLDSKAMEHVQGGPTIVLTNNAEEVVGDPLTKAI